MQKVKVISCYSTVCRVIPQIFDKVLVLFIICYYFANHLASE